MASQTSQQKTRVEQDIENWKKQQMLLGNKGAAIPGGSINLNQLLYSGSNGSGANYSTNQGGYSGQAGAS